jgi:hypothetical protein
MEYENEIPFSSYDELVKAVHKDGATISLWRSIPLNLANRNSHWHIIFGLGVVFGSLVLLTFSHFVINNCRVMLFAIVIFFLNTIVPHIKKP